MKVGIAKIAAFLFLIAFGFLFVYRTSGLYGPEVSRGCGLAIVVSVAAAIAGILPMLKCVTSGVLAVGIASIVGSVTRLFFTVGLSFFVARNGQANGWFFVFAVLFYLVFLLIETSVAVKIVKKEDADNI